MRINEIKRFPDYIDKQSSVEYIWNDCNKLLANYGFMKIGSGSYGTVFAHNNLNYVLKLFADDTAYTDYIEFCLRHQNNPYFPKFRGKLIKISDNVGAVRMEELLPFDLTEGWLIPIIDDYVNFRQTEVDLGEYDSNLIVALDLLRDWISENEYYIDIKSSNIMRRNNGHIVFTDPVADL